jgi:hypothetical protein
VITTSFLKMSPLSRKFAPNHRPQAAPSELKACDRFRRKDAPSGLPIEAISGLAATCSRVTPEAITNRPTRKTPKVCSLAAAMAMKQPATMPPRPTITDLA